MAQPPVPPHRVRLPSPLGVFDDWPRAKRDFMNELVAGLQRELDQRPVVTSAQPELLLLAPGGKVYAVSVNDAGLVVTTLRYG